MRFTKSNANLKSGTVVDKARFEVFNTVPRLKFGFHLVKIDGFKASKKPSREKNVKTTLMLCCQLQFCVSHPKFIFSTSILWFQLALCLFEPKCCVDQPKFCVSNLILHFSTYILHFNRQLTFFSSYTFWKPKFRSKLNFSFFKLHCTFWNLHFLFSGLFVFFFFAFSTEGKWKVHIKKRKKKILRVGYKAQNSSWKQTFGLKNGKFRFENA